MPQFAKQNAICWATNSHHKTALQGAKKDPSARRWGQNNSVGAPGFEPGTSCSQSRRDTGLRYAPK
jgi:hypothetical protein